MRAQASGATITLSIIKDVACPWEVSLLNLHIVVKQEAVVATFGLNGVHCVFCGKEVECKPGSPAWKTGLVLRGEILTVPPSFQERQI